MIVVCDMGGTLSKGAPVLALIKWVKENQNALRGNAYMLSIFPSYFLAKNGMLDMNKWVAKLMATSLRMIKDATPEIFDEICEYIVETQMWPERRVDMIARIRQHVQDGDEVHIASGGWEPLVQAFAERIGAQGMGTHMAFRDGQVMLAEDIAHGQLKINKVLNRLGVTRVDVAYGDTHADILLLEHADHPVAVYPDEGLKAAALERGWEIYGERKK